VRARENVCVLEIESERERGPLHRPLCFSRVFFFCITLGLELSDTKFYEP